MPRRVVSRRFDLESLEHRLTPSMSSLPPGLSHSNAEDVRAHPFAPSSQAANTPTQTQTFSLQGLGGLFRQVLVVDLTVRLPVLRLDFSFNNTSLLEFSTQVSNLKTKVTNDPGSDQGSDSSDNADIHADAGSRASTASVSTTNSPSRQNQQAIVPTNALAQANVNTPTSNPAQANSTGVNTAGQAVTTATDRNVLLTTPGARNTLLAQDRFDTATLPPVVNPIQLPLQEQQPIANGPAAAPLRPQLTLPLNGGGNTPPQAPPQEEAIEEPVLPLNLEGADPVVPLLPTLLDQFLEETPIASVREWIFTAMPGNPFWAYALVAAAGSAGAGWLGTRRKEKRKGEPFTPDDDDALTDGYPS